MKKTLILLSILFATITTNAQIGVIKIKADSTLNSTEVHCHGQLLPISSHQTYFNRVGTTYGGDGITTVGVPDFRGRVILGEGFGPGLTSRTAGQKIGAESQTLYLHNLPYHGHALSFDTVSVNYGSDVAVQKQGSGNTAYTSNTGANVPINNIQPSLTVYVVIRVK